MRQYSKGWVHKVRALYEAKNAMGSRATFSLFSKSQGSRAIGARAIRLFAAAAFGLSSLSGNAYGDSPTPVQTKEAKPQAFTTDGCSMFPDGDFDDPARWQACCVAHDKAYWRGGTYSEREAADAELEACVAELGLDTLGTTMYLGVRVGGSPWFPTSYRWGYAWPYLRGYAPLTAREEVLLREVGGGSVGGPQ